MMTPVGSLPSLPLLADTSLVPATEFALTVPENQLAEFATLRRGSILSAVVRFRGDEILLAVGDRFFTANPVPGLEENDAISLLVSQRYPEFILVPLLPATRTVSLRESKRNRPSSNRPALEPPDNAGKPDVLMHLPEMTALRSWLAASGRDQIPADIPQWISLLVRAMRSSGLHYERSLLDQQGIESDDIKRRLLDAMHTTGNRQAADALEELISMQVAAMLAAREGRSLLPFSLPISEPELPPLIVLDSGTDQDGRSRSRARVSVAVPGGGGISIEISETSPGSFRVTAIPTDLETAKQLSENSVSLSERMTAAGLQLDGLAVQVPTMLEFTSAEKPSLSGTLVSILA
jgi:hypothetical protein